MALIDTLRLIGSPDTNKVMMAELTRLSQRALARRPPVPRKQGQAGLIYPFDADLAMVAMRWQRTVTRVLWDLYESNAERLEPLYDELLADVTRDERTWYWDGARISVRARNVAAFAAGPRQIVGTVKNAIIDGARSRGFTLHVDPDAPDIHLVARMQDEFLTVSIDLAGESLSQHGYRREQGPAPLREHLAAVLCMLARYDARSDILLDPMCGAGTICIEGALMARAVPHGEREEPALYRLPVFQSARARGLTGPLFADTRPMIIGNEIDRRTCAAARKNAEDAGVADSVVWLQGDFRALTLARVESLVAERTRAAGPGLILSNPPYGHRLDDAELVRLYRDLGDWCSQFRGWRAGFLVANEHWKSAFGRRPRLQKPFRNGPIHGYFYLYEL